MSNQEMPGDKHLRFILRAGLKTKGTGAWSANQVVHRGDCYTSESFSVNLEHLNFMRRIFLSKVEKGSERGRLYSIPFSDNMIFTKWKEEMYKNCQSSCVTFNFILKTLTKTKTGKDLCPRCLRNNK